MDPATDINIRRKPFEILEDIFFTAWVILRCLVKLYQGKNKRPSINLLETSFYILGHCFMSYCFL